MQKNSYNTPEKPCFGRISTYIFLQGEGMIKADYIKIYNTLINIIADREGVLIETKVERINTDEKEIN